MVEDLVIEKIGIEVSRQAYGQRLPVEKFDIEKCFAVGECRLIGQWELSIRRHAREAEDSTARRVAQHKYMEKQ